jgi:ATP-binding cassette subfamily F protein 3
VSHDRRFLENVTTRIVLVRDGRADVYPGGFRDFESATRAPKDEPPRAKEPKGEPKASDRGDKAGSDEASKQKYEAARMAARAVEKKKRRIQELETAIAAGERDLDVLRGKLKESPGDDWEKLAKMAGDEQALAKKVDSMLMEWARLSEEVQ